MLTTPSTLRLVPCPSDTEGHAASRFFTLFIALCVIKETLRGLFLFGPLSSWRDMYDTPSTLLRVADIATV
jgi:hypothetical protein